jgi:two-component sensor histidine kinase
VIKTADGEVERLVGVMMDITRRKDSERRQQLLLQELNHRVKNTLAVVQSIASQTLRSRRDPEHFVTAFTSRIGTLARSHDLLTRNVWQGASLKEVVEGALSTFQTEAGAIEVSGPDATLIADDTVALSLVLHELATNAAKYGSLSLPGGKLAVAWTIADAGPDRYVDLHWRESGGPPVTAPDSEGFGSRLITALSRQLGGTVTLDYRPDGLVCDLRFKLRDPHKPLSALLQ